MLIPKMYIKPVMNSAVAVSVLTMIGIETLKRSNNAELRLSGQELADETVGSMLLTEIDNELSKVGDK